MLKKGVDNPKILLVAKIISVAAILWFLYSLMIKATSPGYIRPAHICFVLLMGYFIAPKPGKSKLAVATVWTIDTLLILGVIASTIYIFTSHDQWIIRYAINATQADVFFSIITTVVVLIMTKRLLGWPMVIVTLLAMAYGLFGHHFVGEFRTIQISWQKMFATMYNIQDGYFGMLVGVCSTYVLSFVFVGKLIEISGTGDYFTELAGRLTGRARGGPAKVAVVSSSLFGTVSGSGAANVVATGTFTIPLMKKTGYNSHFAAAVEAVASTGGQIMPPIMSSAGFLAAEISGIPYGRFALAAMVPAILYYVSLYITLDLEAGRLKLNAMDAADLQPWKRVLSRSYLLTPLMVIVLVLVVLNQSPLRGALYAMICGIILFVVNPETRVAFVPTLKKIIDAMYKTGASLAGIGAAFACASVIVAILNVTGVAVKFSSLILAIGEGSMFLSLLLTAVITIILGMGLPVAASYVIAASVCVGALLQLGVPLVAAHLFIFHFASLSALTPPVCLAAYTAGGISGDKPIKVGFTSVRIALVAFAIPFFFAVNPNMLVILNGGGPATLSFITGMIGCAGIAFFTIGWYRDTIIWPLRIGFLVGGLLMVESHLVTDMIGIAILTVAVLFHFAIRRKQHKDGDSLTVEESASVEPLEQRLCK